MIALVQTSFATTISRPLSDTAVSRLLKRTSSPTCSLISWCCSSMSRHLKSSTKSYATMNLSPCPRRTKIFGRSVWES